MTASPSSLTWINEKADELCVGENQSRWTGAGRVSCAGLIRGKHFEALQEVSGAKGAGAPSQVRTVLWWKEMGRRTSQPQKEPVCMER